MARIGKIYLVGAGPGDPELLTLKAHRLLAQADLVLHDDLVPSAIVSLAAPQAQVLSVGKRCGAKTITQDEINARMIDAAQRGLLVVRLKSGDPGIFGRLAEEIDALESAEIPCEVVPGVTAGVAAAASLGISLTDRRKSARVVIVTGHKAHGQPNAGKLDWANLAREDATLIIYMPGHEFTNLRRELLQAGLPHDIPAVIVSRASTAGQRHQFCTLGGLANLPRFESPSILLIGRSLERPGEKSRSGQISSAIHCAELMLSSD
jgi:uroporphyrin-III C-methyltransferase